MIAEQALRLAGDGAHLVHRPAGRLHVYTGPLTRSGRFVPRSARVLCRAHTRRLEVIDDRVVGLSTLDAREPSPGVCARCSARLALRSPGRAEQHPQTRDAFRAAYADTSAADLAFALQVADTPAEVDAAAHLTLALFGVAGTLKPFTSRGRDWPPLHQLVHDARTRVHGFPDSAYRDREREDALAAANRDAAAKRRKDAHADREARIARLGFTNARATTGSTR